MLAELKTKLDVLKRKVTEPSVEQQIAQTELAIKEEERKAHQEREVKVMQERTKLKEKMVREIILTAKCVKCGKSVELARADESFRNHAREIIIEGVCQNLKCAVMPEFVENADLKQTILYTVLPLQAGKYRGVMQR